jgi:hypothetical protein
MFQVLLGDGTNTNVRIDGDVNEMLDPSLPLVILLHGLGATEADMTAPLTRRGGVAFNQAAAYPFYRDEGIRLSPPPLPVARFYADPPLSSVTSWRDALNAAGFATASYTQNGGTIGVSATQLAAFASGPLSTDSRLSGVRIAFLGHSRGGLIARSFLVSASTNPALAPLLARVTALITLHSPHSGSGLASAAVAVDGLAARLQALIASVGLAPLGLLTMLRSFTGDPNISELMPGSATLAGIAGGEGARGVPGIAYHTFGGTSTRALRVLGDVYTPDSTVPLFLPFVPFPIFHWGSTPVVIGAPLDVASFVPTALLAPTPFVTELVTLLGALAATTPELANGFGDVLVTNASAHLPFSATRTVNPLNHAEALWDPTLHSQVIAILSRLRTTAASGRATVRISPYPVSITPATHVVTANDAVTGGPMSGTVVVYDAHGGLALRVPVGSPFTYGFTSRRLSVVSPDTHRPTWEVVWPSVQVELSPPYGVLDLDIGRG